MQLFCSETVSFHEVDLQSLAAFCWLTDNVIDFYFEHLQQKEEERWEDETKEESDVLFVPACVSRMLPWSDEDDLAGLRKVNYVLSLVTFNIPSI